MSSVSRRRFIALAGAGLGAGALTACSVTSAAVRSEPMVWPPVEATPTPAPAPTPRPIEPRGRRMLKLLPDTDYAADGIAIHSGKPGPRIMVLGGVHGNEPGGWLAAEAIADWELESGSMLVLPRVNWRAAAVMERTFQDYGDLNRAYPGNTTGLPMQRMAAAIIEAGNDFGPELLFDLHESWVFFGERGAASGTAYLGQTVSIGGGANDWTVDRIANVVRAVNGQISAREEFYMRGAARPRPGVRVIPSATPRPGSTPTPPPNGVTFGGTSSLSLGQWIKGCVPVLIEMGQQEQTDSRRSALHQMLVRTALQQSGMV